MPTVVTVLYPRTSSATFDLSYYLSKHMPFVQESFGPHGMVGWRIAQFDDPNSQYSIQATLEFGSADEVQKALQAQGGPVLDDVKNFSNVDPVIMVGEVVGGHGNCGPV